MRELLSLTVLIVVSCASAVEANACTAAGRFPNAAVPGCRAFFMCIAGAGGSFSQYNLTCPLDFVFNPAAGVCTDSANYECPSSSPLLYPCNGTGHFENPNATDCRSYIVCSSSALGELIPRILDCPEGHIFETLERNCVNETRYNCGEAVEPRKPAPVASATSENSLLSHPLVVTSLVALILHRIG